MRVHIIGAGISGLAAAVRAVQQGHHVCVYEATGQAGGRCRSVVSPVLGRQIDNGTHVVLAGNRGVNWLLSTVAARQHWQVLDTVAWYDRRDNVLTYRTLSAMLWQVLGGVGPVVRLLAAGKPVPVAACLPVTPRSRLVCESILNTPPEEAAASALRSVLVRAALMGRSARMMVAKKSFQDSLIGPITHWLAVHGVEIRYHHRVQAIRHGQVCFDIGAVSILPEDRVIVAVPMAEAHRLGLVPAVLPASPISNLHFACPVAPSVLSMGVIGGVIHWLSWRDGVLSVTISGRIVDDVVAVWAECADILGLPAVPVPACQKVIEKRATLRHTPAVEALRKRIDHRPMPQVFLAGDYTANLPCTLEGSIATALRLF